MDYIDEDAEVTFETNSKPVTTLRRSWPQTIQEIEFRCGVTLRGKLPTGDGDLREPLPLGSKKYDWNPIYRERRAVRGRNKQPLNWKQLPEERVVGLDKGSIWNGGSGLFDIENNSEELAKISSLFDSSSSPKRRSVRAGKESVLGSKRVTALSMALRRLKLDQRSLAKMCWALREMDEKYITRSSVEMMLKCSLWAKNSELQAIKERFRVHQDLAEPDMILWTMAVIVPDASLRIKALGFRYEFDDLFESLIRATSLIKSAALEVCTSELLKRLMRVVMQIGNKINLAFGGVAARGISIKSLSKLSTVKTSDKSMSVLDCVVTYLDQVFPEAFGAGDDCTCVAEAAKYSLKEQAKALEKARSKVAFIKRFPDMDRFYWYTTKKLDAAEKELRLAKVSFGKCLQYFCAPEDMDTDEFFGCLTDFFQCLDVAVAAHEVRERMGFSRTVSPSPVNDRAAASNSSVSSTSSKKSVGSTRLSIFTRPSSSAMTGADSSASKKHSSMALTNRKSVFGRMRPVKE